jgi:hypothetical protein
MSRRLAVPRLVLSVALALVLAGCGGGKSGSGSGGGNVPPPPPPVQQQQTALIRLRGITADPSRYVSYLVDVRRATVLVDGAVVADVAGPGPVDLMRPDQAWALVRFDEPAPGKVVEVRLALGDGSAVSLAAPDGSDAALDARPGAVRFEFPSIRLGARHHAVVHLDLDRSRVDAGGTTRALVPQYVVYF